MNYNLKKPCSKCPFRNDIEPYLTYERAEEISDSIVDQQQSFPCHKTTVDSDNDDGERIETDKTEHCAGALIMLEHMGRPNQMMRIAERMGYYDQTKLEMDSPVFEDTTDWVYAHG